MTEKQRGLLLGGLFVTVRVPALYTVFECNPFLSPLDSLRSLVASHPNPMSEKDDFFFEKWCRGKKEFLAERYRRGLPAKI